MGSESGPSSPLTQEATSSKKRCSLPGTMGSLNLYATHQQRRLSERGLMVYRPSKPDIDLIGDFINPNKKSMNLGNLNASSGASASTSALGLSAAQSMTTYSVNVLPTIASPSRSPTNNANTSLPAQTISSGSSPFLGSTMASEAVCRKVRIRIQKSPGGKENKFVEMQTIQIGCPSATRSASVSVDRSDVERDEMFLRHPLFDSRRFSDSMTCTPPKINNNLSTGGGDAGIVCSTGDLRALKCLTSSAQEIRFYGSMHNATISYGNEAGTSAPESLGNRSRSFDATSTVITSNRKGIGSSWFTRRHVPISVKLPMSLRSPSVPNSPGPNQLTLKAPILTVTNETSGQSELIEVPSPPSATTPCDDAKTKVTWDQSGFLVDAAVLGSVIENHLRKTDMRRRATVSTLYEQQNSIDDPQITTRARSASACVIPNHEMENRESILGPTLGFSQVTSLPIAVSTNQSTSRRSSIKSPMVSTNIGGRISFQATETGKGETMKESVRKQKRFSLSGPSCYSYTPGNSIIPKAPDYFNTNRGRDFKGRSNSNATPIPAQSFVETVDTSGKVNIVKTTTQSSYTTPYTYTIPPIHGRISTDDEQEDESRRRAAYYKKVNGQSQGGAMSICSAIRDFIVHSLKS